MIEEKQNSQSQDNCKKLKNARSVLIYLIILFAAAIILLLLAFFMQQRNNQTISDLRDSISSFESLNDLLEENRDLREQLEEMEDKTADLQSQLSKTNQLYEELNEEFSSSKENTEYLSALYTLYTAEIKAADKDYAAAAALLTDWGELSDLSSILMRYDAKTEQNSSEDDEALLLYPRYEALIITLTDMGCFEDKTGDEPQISLGIAVMDN